MRVNIILGNVKIGLHLLLIMLLVLTGCRRHTVNSNDSLNADATERKARDYLLPFLHTGEAATNITAEFGAPMNKYRTSSGEVCMDFWLPDDDTTAHAAGVGGFAAFFRDNKLSHWDPTYRYAPSELIKSLPINENNALFKSDHPVIIFDLVSEVQKPQMTYIDTASFPKLGYIPDSPNLGVRSGHYTTYDDSSSSLRTIRVLLLPSDAEGLNILTSNNIGKRLAVLVGSQVILATYVRTPLSNGDLVLRLPGPAYSILSSALRENEVNTH